VLMLDMLNTEFGAELTLRLRTQLRWSWVGDLL